MPAPPALAAQGVPGAIDLVQLQRRYDAAVRACEAAGLAREAYQQEYDRALQSVNAAARQSDDDALARAQSRFLETSQVMDARQRRVVERCDEAEAVRQEYLDGLDARRRALENELATAEEESRIAYIGAVLTDIDFQYQELESDRDALELQPVMRPLIRIVPTDTPDAVRAKAAFLERLVNTADSVIAEFDEEVERLESRLRRQQGVENFERGLNRYDDIRTPVSSGAGERDSRTALANDSTALTPGSLEGRIRAIRDARIRIEFYQEQIRDRIREFRDYLARIT